MHISIVVAMAVNGVIGRQGSLPWHLPADLKHFRSITMGKPIIMGRVTHESIGRPLPGRDNVILTRSGNYRAPGCEIVHKLDNIFCRYANTAEVMIIGGSQLYARTILLAEKLYITEVHAAIEGDTYFPEFDRDQWLESERQDFSADEKNSFDYSFVVLEKIQQSPAGSL